MFEHERSLVQKMAGRPFVLLGVDGDASRETLQHAQKKYQLNWRSWWDGEGFIAMRWHVDRIPTLFFIDHKGMVRGRMVGPPDSPRELDDAIESLVQEAESESQSVSRVP